MTAKGESLIAQFMPHYALREIDRVAVAAPADRAFEVARHIDLYRVAFVRRLFELRLVPERIGAWVQRKPYPKIRSSRIDDIASAGSGFLLLGEQPGREVVIGSVGKFWQPSIDFVPVTPEEFVDFEDPGFGKLAWCIRVDPRVGGGAWLTVEVRVGTTDVASLARFKRYWTVIGRFSRAIRHGVLRLLVAELGPPASDDSRPLAGDDLLPAARFQRTHATTIEAPVEKVWPWLVQMGGRRAGWYSFDALDNDGMPSADHIIPELQSLKVGDVIPALPKSADGFAVLRIERPQTLILGDPSLVPGGTRSPSAPPWKTSWAFTLEPIGGEATRLTVRVRAAYEPSMKMALMAPSMGLVHEAMERRQLRNLRRRAERSEGSREARA